MFNSLGQILNQNEVTCTNHSESPFPSTHAYSCISSELIHWICLICGQLSCICYHKDYFCCSPVFYPSWPWDVSFTYHIDLAWHKEDLFLTLSFISLVISMSLDLEFHSILFQMSTEMFSFHFWHFLLCLSFHNSVHFNDTFGRLNHYSWLCFVCSSIA